MGANSNFSQFVIRHGAAGEIDAVLKLWRLSEARPSATDSEQAVRQLLDRDRESLLVASAGEVYRLAVHPGWRRRGVAMALIRAGEERLRSLGAVRLTAIVAGDEPAATTLWAAAGYERQADTSRFVRMFES